MKASELRLGNYVIDNRARICQVTEINNDTSEIAYGFMAWPINGEGTTTTPHKPIPLTEQWLLDFGFKEGSNTEYTNNTYVKKGVSFWNKNRDFTCIVFETFRGLEINYVHQLQNLYHSLTGEELTIKEKVK